MDPLAPSLVIGSRWGRGRISLDTGGVKKAGQRWSRGPGAGGAASLLTINQLIASRATVHRNPILLARRRGERAGGLSAARSVTAAWVRPTQLMGYTHDLGSLAFELRFKAD
jgi:hypothetical protein